MSGAVCYQVHSHRSPAQVERLVGRLCGADGSSAVVVVSHDASGEPLDVPALERLGDVHVLRSRGGYGDMSHVDRWVECVRWLDTHGVDYDWVVTLSGQDYPVQPLALVEKELRESGVDGFVEHFPVFSPESHWPAHLGRTRYLFRHRRPRGLAGLSPAGRRVLRLASAVNRVQPFVRVNAMYGSIGVRTRTPFRPGLPLYGGSFFTSLHRDAAAYVRACYEAEPEVVRHFRGTLAPEEAYFQTVLVAAGRFRLSGDCKRYFDFSQRRDGRPRVLGVADLDRLLASGAHFARKFDAGADPRVLDLLDEHL